MTVELPKWLGIKICQNCILVTGGGDTFYWLVIRFRTLVCITNIVALSKCKCKKVSVSKI